MYQKMFVAMTTAAGILLTATASFAIGTKQISPVPEPATLTLMAIGLGGVAAANRLRKRNKK